MSLYAELTRSPLQILTMRHTGLDPVSHTLGWDYAPSPDWGRPGWGVPRKGIFLVVILNSGAERSVIQNPLHWGWTSSPSPTWGRPGWGASRKGFVLSSLRARHGVPYEFSIIVTPAHEPESPMNSEGFKLFRPLQSNQLCDSETAALAINGYGYAFHPLLVLFRVTTPHSNSLPIGRENKMFFTAHPTMRH